MLTNGWMATLLNIRNFLLGCVVVLSLHSPLHAVYIRRYVTIANGEMTYTGNTLGLSKHEYLNQPGIYGSIGTFITTDTGSRDGTDWPYGTIADWRQNASSAQLRLPVGSTVLYAELIWGGSYRFGDQDVSANLNDPINFTTPLGTYSVSPDPSTAATLNGKENYYVRSADVTALIQPAGAGTYTVGGVPGTEVASERYTNVAGWTLAVIYENTSLLARNMTIFVGAELTSPEVSTTSSVRGFSTPESGPVHARMMVTAMEGDSRSTGDQMQFGPTRDTMTPVFGPNNPIDNFFCSQINDDFGNLDTEGTFGTSNHTPGSNSIGARQGWDITNIDISAQMLNGQTTAFARGTTGADGDRYIITSIGLQIDVAAPRFPTAAMSVDKSQTYVGDSLTYTVKLDNTAGTVDASNIFYTDTPPHGTTFIPGTFTIEGVAQPNADPVAGVPIGTVATGSVVTVTYQAHVHAIPFPPAGAEYWNNGMWTFQYRSAPGLPLNNSSVTTSPDVVTLIPRLLPTKTANPSASAFPGDVITYTISIPNMGTANTSGTTLLDLISEGTTYVQGSTALNGVAVADNGGAMSFARGALVHSPGAPAGQITVGEAATVTFQVTVAPDPPLLIANIARIDPDGDGLAPPIEAVATNPPPTADLAVSITDGQDTAVPGSPISYRVTVTNHGPEERPLDKLLLEIPLPPEITFPSYTPSTGTYHSDTWIWSDLALGAGQSITFTVNGTVSPSARGSFTATATVVPAPWMLDPNRENNTDSDTDTLIPQADLSITKTDGRTNVRPGNPTTYTLTVTNNGPSRVKTLTVQDDLPPVLLDPEFRPDQGVYNADMGVWTGLYLGPGQSVLLSLTATVDPDASGLLENTVTVFPPTGVTDPNSDNNTATDRNALRSAGTTGTIISTTPIAPGETVTVTVTDADLNLYSGTAETFRLVTTNPVTGETESLTYTETEGNTGVFVATVHTVYGTVPGTNDDGVFAVQKGDTLSTTYDDELTEAGETATVTATTIVVQPLLTVTKEVDKTSAKPDELLTYTITYANNGDSDARDVYFTDSISEHTAYVLGSAAGGGTTITFQHAEGDSFDASETLPVTAIIWTLTDPLSGPGGSGTLTLQVRVNADAPAGTNVENVAVMNYKNPQGTPQPPVPSNPKIFVVAPLVGVSVTPDSAHYARAPGDTVQHAFLVTNTGSSNDTFELTGSGGIYAWEIWRDLNSSKVVDDGDDRITDTDGDGTPDTGELTPGASEDFVARAVIPAETADLTQDLHTVTATSSVDGAVRDHTKISTTVRMHTPPSGVDGTITATDSIVAGQVVSIVVEDADLNTDPTRVETLTLETFNQYTGEVETLIYTETGPDTGIFTTQVNTTFGEQKGTDNDGTFHVREGHVLTTTYRDALTSTGGTSVRFATTDVIHPHITLEPDPDVIVANGRDISVLTARVTAGNEQPLPDGTPVTFTTNKGTFENGEQRIIAPIEGGNGEATTVLTAPLLTASSVAEVQAIFGGVSSDAVRLTVLPGGVNIRVFDAERGTFVRADDPNVIVQMIVRGTADEGSWIELVVEVDSTGVYLASDLPPGTYEVQTVVSDRATGETFLESAPQRIRVNPGGDVEPAKNTLSGTIRSRTDPTQTFGYAQIQLYDENGTLRSTTQADAAGNYTFDSVEPGNYYLIATAPDGRRGRFYLPPITRDMGVVVINADALIDPFGVAFNARTGEGVSGVLVAIVDPQTGQDLRIPWLPEGNGASPNFYNGNPFVTVDKGLFAFLFGGDQVGQVGQPVRYEMRVDPRGAALSPRSIRIDVSPVSEGKPLVRLVAVALDSLPLCEPGRFDLVEGPVVVPNIETVALNIPLFSTEPPLEVSKTAPDSVLAGRDVIYRIAYRNVSALPLDSVVVSDKIPEGTLFVESSGGGVFSDSVVTWELGTVPAGAADTLGMTVRVDSAFPAGAEGIVNRAVVGGRNILLGDIPTVYDEVTIVVSPSPVLEIEKGTAMDSVRVGDEVEYTLVVRNVGNGPATAVTVSDTLPSDLGRVSVPGKASYQEGNLLWPVGDLAPGEADTLRFKAEVPTRVADGQRIWNRAWITAENAETTPDSAVVIAWGKPDLQISKTSEVDFVRVGDEVEYTLVARNVGNGPATAVTVSDTLPSDLELLSVSVPDRASYPEGNLLWSVGDLAPGETDTLRIRTKVSIRVADGQRFVNRAWITAENAETVLDSAVVTVRGQADLWISKKCDPTEGRLGETITYTVVVGNQGTADAQGVTVEDRLPTALEYVEGSGPSNAVYWPETRTLVWSPGTVAPGAADTLTFRIRIDGDLTPGMHAIENTAQLLNDGERIPSNPVTLHVLVPYLKIEKSANKTVVEPGDIVRYQVTVSNASSSDRVDSVYVEDHLPHSFEYVDGTTLLDGRRAGNPAGGRPMKWEIGDLGPSESRTLHYMTVVGAGAEDGSGVNEATAYGYDPTGTLFPSDPARKKVLIRPNLFAPGGVILGKVWVDANGNRIHDHGERTVPGVFLMLEDGTRVTTDEYGNYSIPEVKPGDHVLWLLEESLPPGLRPVASENAFAGDSLSQFVSLPKYATAKANFMLVSTAVPIEKQAARVVPSGELRIWNRVLPERVLVPVERTVVRIGSAYFRTGSAKIRPEMRSSLKEVCAQLTDALYIRVEGHTDSSPIHTAEFPSNRELSEARAQAVAAFLSEVCGIDRARMTAAGYGPMRPIASNETAAGRARNRRVEVIPVYEKEGAKVTVRYELTVGYTGEEPAQGVALVDSLPSAARLLEKTVSVEGVDATVEVDSLGRMVWDLGELSSEQEVRVGFDVEVEVAGLDSLVNAAYLRHGSEGRQPGGRAEAVLYLDRGDSLQESGKRRNP